MFTVLLPTHPTGFDTPYGRHPSLHRRPTHGPVRRRPISYYETEPEPAYPSYGYPQLARRPSAPVYQHQPRRASYYSSTYTYEEEYEAFYAEPVKPARQQRPVSLTEVQLRALIIERQQREERQRIEAIAAGQRELAARFPQNVREPELHRRGAIRRKTEEERLAELEAERVSLLARKQERDARERAELEAARAAQAAAEERQAKIRKMREVKERHKAERLAAARAEREKDSEIEGQRREAQRLVVETFLGELVGLFLDNSEADTTAENAKPAPGAPVDVKGKGKAREEPVPEPQPEKTERKVRFRGEYAGPSYTTPEEKAQLASASAPETESVPVTTPSTSETTPATPAETATSTTMANNTTTQPEQPARPESPARDLALQHVQLLLAKFESLTYAFAFPRVLSFSDNASSSNPKLAYTAQNAPVHTYEHALNGLLQELDAVESDGDREVRKARRELVKRVERELGWLEQEIRRTWERQTAVEEEVPATPEPELEPETEVEQASEEAVVGPAEQATTEQPATESEPVKEEAATEATSQSETETRPVDETVDPATTNPEADELAETKAALNEFLAADAAAVLPVATEAEEVKEVQSVSAESEEVKAPEAEDVAPASEPVSVCEEKDEPSEVPAEEAAPADVGHIATEEASPHPAAEGHEITQVIEEPEVKPEETEQAPSPAEPTSSNTPDEQTTPAVAASPTTSPLLSGAFVPIPEPNEPTHSESSDEEQVIAESSSAEVEEDVSGSEGAKSEDGYELV